MQKHRAPCWKCLRGCCEPSQARSHRGVTPHDRALGEGAIRNKSSAKAVAISGVALSFVCCTTHKEHMAGHPENSVARTNGSVTMRCHEQPMWSFRTPVLGVARHSRATKTLPRGYCTRVLEPHSFSSLRSSGPRQTDDNGEAQSSANSQTPLKDRNLLWIGRCDRLQP